MVKSTSPHATMIPVGHAPETNSLHHEELNEERRRAAFVIGTESWFGLLLNATSLVLHDWFE